MTEIRVLNVTDGEELCFPLALLQGEITGLRKFESSDSKYPRVEHAETPETAAAVKLTPRERARTHVVSRNSTLLVENGQSSSLEWPVLAGYFKILVPLQAGENKITISHVEGCVSKSITLIYKPQTKERYVRLVYVKCADSEGDFQAPEGGDNSAESAVKRLQFNSRLLQTFTAENLNHHGLGRYTFKLEEDESGVPVVHIFTSKLMTEEALKMSGGELYDYFGKELRRSDLYDRHCKWVVFMSCTRYDPPEGDEFEDKKAHSYAKAHTALGGGSLAVFGTGGLHTWATDLESLVKRFTDTQVIDRRKLFDDSCGRGTHWANYSTGLGATMHELGHAFDLAHTPRGIMSRGFDDMNCVFTISPFHKIEDSVSVDLLSSDSGSEIADIKSKKTTPWPADYPALTSRGAHWYRSSAVLLRYHRWIGDKDMDEECEEWETPTVHWSSMFHGPVGNFGTSCQKNQTSFNDASWLLENNARMGGVVVYAAKYVNSIQTVAVKQEDDDQESQVLSDPRGNTERGKRYEFIFDSPDERLTRIDVRAGAWIDAVRFHSTKKSSKWLGGTGGDYHKFVAPGGRWFTGLFGTSGNLLGSLGAHLNTPEDTIETPNDIEASGSDVVVESSAGLRLIELHDHRGEVCRHWEFLEPNPPRNFPLPRNEIFSVDQRRTLIVMDDKGAIFRTGVTKEMHSLAESAAANTAVTND